MADAIDKGSTSVHVGKRDMTIIEDMEWENVGASKIFSRALRRTEKLEELKDLKKAFDRGSVNLGEILNQLEEL